MLAFVTDFDLWQPQRPLVYGHRWKDLVNGCLSTRYVFPLLYSTWWLTENTGDHGSDGHCRLVVPTTLFTVL